MSRSRLAAQTLLGGIVVLIGLALLGRSTGLFDASALFVYVPSLFVLVGIYALVSGGLRNLVGPLLVILVAGAWQLVTLGVLAARDVVQFWPLLIILFGLSLLLGQYRAKDDPSGAITSCYSRSSGARSDASRPTPSGART
ncbi:MULTISPECIES: hypothetical protein [Haloarcula]|uniref:LiaF transmembrane domain-containing protein n=1 Tax=Haloarcula TaxID=2237 RepID=UPI001CDA0654|nr:MULTISPECIES: hypothetical protein [Haloarcula]